MGLSPVAIAAKEDFHAAANPIVAAGISLTRNVRRSIISPPENKGQKSVHTMACLERGVKPHAGPDGRSNLLRTANQSDKTPSPPTPLPQGGEGRVE